MVDTDVNLQKCQIGFAVLDREDIDLLVVRLSFMYIGYVKPLRVGEKFIDKLCENIKKLEFPERLEDHFIALAIAAFGSKPQVRQELCCRALDALDIFYSDAWRSQGKGGVVN